MDTPPHRLATPALPLRLLLFLCALAPLFAQSRPPEDWRRLGNSSQIIGLSSPAGGPVDRAWFAPDGRLFLRLPDRRVFSTTDLESWQPAEAAPPDRPAPPSGARSPENSAVIVPARPGSPTLYAAGLSAWRSEDGGLNWSNLTLLRGESLLGGPLRDLAVDPSDPQRLVAATSSGLWLSLDAGLSWLGLNDGLPNLPIRRLLAAPAGSRGVRIAVQAGDALRELEWLPGNKSGWTLSSSSLLNSELDLRAALSARLDARITAAAQQGDALYAGSADGRLFLSLDNGASFRSFQAANAPVERILTDPSDRNFALAALSAPNGPRLLRTLNAGSFWDDLSSNLPDGPVYGLAADRNSGALYAATARGLFYTLSDLRAPAAATPWLPLASSLPAAPVRDVRLDDGGNLLLAALDGYGVYSTLAPHRARLPLVVHSFDYSARAAAPGALLSVLGANVRSASANQSAAVVLDARDAESQIQIPYTLSGSSLQLVVEAAQGRLVFPLALKDTAPAILVDRDGSPMLLDADSGTQLDAMHPARPGMRLQILMSGLGRVAPDWPAGLAAPLSLDEAPKVLAPLSASLDGAPLPVTRATLAPGLIGYYLVELQLPEFLDSGAAELLLSAAGNPSNRVRLYLAQ